MLSAKNLIRAIGVIRGLLKTKAAVKMTNLLYKEEVYDIVGICMNVYNTLGFGFLEVVYKDAMEFEFVENEKEHQREKEFPILYKGRKLKRTFYTDFLMFDKIIVEVKASAEGIPEDAIAQTINYLKAAGKRVGLIINFGKKSLSIKELSFNPPFKNYIITESNNAAAGSIKFIFNCIHS